MSPDTHIETRSPWDAYAPIPIEEIANTTLGQSLDLSGLKGRHRPTGCLDHDLAGYISPKFGKSNSSHSLFLQTHIDEFNQHGISTLRELLTADPSSFSSITDSSLAVRVQTYITRVMGPGPEGLLVAYLSSDTSSRGVPISTEAEIVRNGQVHSALDYLHSLYPLFYSMLIDRFGFWNGKVLTRADIAEKYNLSTHRSLAEDIQVTHILRQKIDVEEFVTFSPSFAQHTLGVNCMWDLKKDFPLVFAMPISRLELSQDTKNSLAVRGILDTSPLTALLCDLPLGILSNEMKEEVSTRIQSRLLP